MVQLAFHPANDRVGTDIAKLGKIWAVAYSTNPRSTMANVLRQINCQFSHVLFDLVINIDGDC